MFEGLKKIAEEVEEKIAEHSHVAETVEHVAEAVEHAAEAVTPLVPAAAPVAAIASEVASAAGAVQTLVDDVTPVAENIAKGDFTVPEGFSWERIAGDFRVSLSELKALNQDIELKAGALIKLPVRYR